MFKRKQGQRFLIAAICLAATATGTTMAQQVRDLTSDPTEEELIETLKPKIEEDGRRDIGLAVKPRPKCSLKQIGGTRDIGLKPVSDVAAIPIPFAFNSAWIQPGSRASFLLDRLGKVLASPEFAPWCFQIDGFTDNIGSDTFNKRLSQQRAEAVLNYLTTNFHIEPDRLNAIGRGKSNRADNSTEEGRSKNRRVEIATSALP
jgi:outer membrane protein OmpA-like peptidoglycan-associated protein